MPVDQHAAPREQERKIRARVAVTMLELIMDQIDKVYTESAKGNDADIVQELGEAKRQLARAQATQLRVYDNA